MKEMMKHFIKKLNRLKSESEELSNLSDEVQDHK